MLEEFYYKLPLDDNGFDFMGFTREQILYMREHRTTSLRPNMFKRFKSSTTDIDDDHNEGEDERSSAEGTTKKLKILEYEGFKLRNTFPQNIALMQDGSLVFCEDFVIPTGHASPVIFGYRFENVSIYNEKEIFLQIFNIVCLLQNICFGV